jgi:hypothetical protein
MLHKPARRLAASSGSGCWRPPPIYRSRNSRRDRLTNAGLLFVRGTPPESSYIFKHVLVQDAAHGTLLRSRRQLLHGQIAAALEERFPEIVLAQPECWHSTARQPGSRNRRSRIG